jgi:ankyrin repeat protein
LVVVLVWALTVNAKKNKIKGKVMVKLLLDKGADINAQGGNYRDALQAASSGGHEQIAQLLLDKGAGVNAPDGEYNYGNAL